MNIHVVNEYFKLAEAGKVLPLSCPVHKEDEPAVFPYRVKDEGKDIILECLACGHKVTIGLTVYNSIEAILRHVGENR